MRICPSCGFSSSDDSNFCMSCGSRLPDVDAHRDNPPGNNDSRDSAPGADTLDTDEFQKAVQSSKSATNRTIRLILAFVAVIAVIAGYVVVSNFSALKERHNQITERQREQSRQREAVRLAEQQRADSIARLNQTTSPQTVQRQLRPPTGVLSYTGTWSVKVASFYSSRLADSARDRWLSRGYAVRVWSEQTTTRRTVRNNTTSRSTGSSGNTSRRSSSTTTRNTNQRSTRNTNRSTTQRTVTRTQYCVGIGGFLTYAGARQAAQYLNAVHADHRSFLPTRVTRRLY